MKNKKLQTAKNEKNDEFYTQLSDIEIEMKSYKDYFKDKVVYCNCDDPRESNFVKYFIDNFETLGLKKLIASCYKPQIQNLFNDTIIEKAVYLEYDGYKIENRIPSAEEIGYKYLKTDGDFRRKECIGFLEQSDIVVTNPPFSLFREFVAQLIKYNKDFIILGNVNAITYKEIFRLFKDDKIWFGVSIHSGDREFRVPEDYPLYSNGYRTDEYGNNYIRVKGVRWFTNIDYVERHENLELTKLYTPEEYPKYDNYDAINVDKTKDIPLDYKGYMGVPITFLDKYNSDQFEIINIDRELLYGLRGKVDRFYLGGKKLYARIVIRNKTL